MPCPSHDELNAFAAGDLDPRERGRVAEHVDAGCAACRRELDAVEALRRVARSGAIADPPPWAVERAARIPEDARGGRLSRLVGTVAALVFDTLRDPLAQGARSAAGGARRMLYKASEYDIDVLVVPAAAGEVRVSGQVLPGPDRPIDFYGIPGETVWGATARILTGFLTHLTRDTSRPST